MNMTNVNNRSHFFLMEKIQPKKLCFFLASFLKTWCFFVNYGIILFPLYPKKDSASRTHTWIGFWNEQKKLI